MATSCRKITLHYYVIPAGFWPGSTVITISADLASGLKYNGMTDMGVLTAFKKKKHKLPPYK